MDVARLSKLRLDGDAAVAPCAGATPAPRQGAPAAARRAARRTLRRAPARSADLGPRRKRWRNAGGDSPCRGNARTQFQCSGHIGHRDLGAACGPAIAGRRNPSVHPARHAALCGALLRALASQSRAARGIRSVAESHPRLHRAEYSADPGQRAPFRALLHALALPAAHDRRAVVALRSVPHAVRA